jgi:hypothetical protein
LDPAFRREVRRARAAPTDEIDDRELAAVAGQSYLETRVLTHVSDHTRTIPKSD